MRLFLLTGLCSAAFASTSAQAEPNKRRYNPLTDPTQASATAAAQNENTRYRLHPLPSYREREETGCRLRVRPIKVKVTCSVALGPR